MINDDMIFIPFSTNSNLGKAITGWIPITIYGMQNFIPKAPIKENNVNNIDLEDNLYQYNPNIQSGTTSNSLNTLNALREFDLDLDEDSDLVRVNNAEIDRVYNNIEKKFPGTFTLLQAYNVPYPIAKLLIRRTIKLSLNYCKYKDGE